MGSDDHEVTLLFRFSVLSVVTLTAVIAPSTWVTFTWTFVPSVLVSSAYRPEITSDRSLSVTTEFPAMPESARLPYSSRAARLPEAEGTALSVFPVRSMFTALSVTVSGTLSTFTVSIMLTSAPASIPASLVFSSVV